MMTVVSYLQIFIPVLVLIVGFFGALKISITRNQEKIIALQDDITEIKNNVKDIVNKIL